MQKKMQKQKNMGKKKGIEQKSNGTSVIWHANNKQTELRVYKDTQCFYYKRLDSL